MKKKRHILLLPVLWELRLIFFGGLLFLVFFFFWFCLWCLVLAEIRAPEVSDC